MDDVAGELSDLADATLGAALAIAEQSWADARDCRLAVVGLGKCGAQELNYVSDVDVLFVAEPRLDESGQPVITSDRAITVATRMAAEMTRICSAHTAAGTIWEVDAALRPEGKAGSWSDLVEPSHLLREVGQDLGVPGHAQGKAECWRSRTGTDFVEMISPMVWRAAGTGKLAADTQAMRKRVIAHIPVRNQDRELKLGQGGLRDVASGAASAVGPWPCRRAPPLAGHTAGTQGAGRQRLRGARTARVSRWHTGSSAPRAPHPAVWSRAARTSRRTTKTTGGWSSSGWRLGAASQPSNWRWRGGVRRFDERLFYSPLLDTVARIPSTELRLTTDAAVDRLKALGYADPSAALRHIAALSQGVTRQVEIQRQLLLAMLGWFAGAPSPDFAAVGVPSGVGSAGHHALVPSSAP